MNQPHEISAASITAGMWSGRRCFIVGGGPSLRGFNFARLAGELTIAINKSFVAVPSPSIMMCMDERYLQWVHQGKRGHSAADQAKFRDLPIKVWLKPRTQKTRFPGVIEIPRAEHSTDIPGALVAGNNSGIGAISLAIMLGASPIYLLGYDMRGDDSGQSAHYHGGYADQQRSNVYDRFLKEFQRHAPAMLERASIVNLNPDSRLECFPKATVDSVLGAAA